MPGGHAGAVIPEVRAALLVAAQRLTGLADRNEREEDLPASARTSRSRCEDAAAPAQN
jgi:hypothetical protein